MDEARNTRKKELIPKIEEYISHHSLFKEREVDVSFAQEGRSSLVAIIETGGRKYVLKTSLIADLIESEGTFLNVWEEDGVSVPHVLKEGILDQRPYILMSFVDAEVLSNAYSGEEMISQRIFVELGSILSKMHARNVREHGAAGNDQRVPAEFGVQFPRFAASRLAYLKEHQILSHEEHGSIDLAIDVIQRYVATDDRSTYCHNDFSPHNAFATNPITIFDPSPSFNHPYIDLGLAIVLAVSLYDSEEVVPQLIQGYFGGEFSRQ